MTMTRFTAAALVAQLQAWVPVPLAGREDDNLIEMGLDSLHVMRLANTWRSQGATATFAELIAQPTLRHWLALLDTAPPAESPARVPEGEDLQHENVRDAQDCPGAAFALTDVQYAYWIGRQDDQVLGGVGCHAYLELDGHGVDPTRLQAAWRQVFAGHAMLRTRFTDAGRQYVDDTLPAPLLAVHDFSTLPAEAAEARVLALRAALSHRRLRVEAGEVAGLALSRLPQGRTRIHVDVDLLAADVHSLHILLRDLAAAYAGDTPPADPAWRFSRYLAIEAERRQPQREAARRYWQDALAELPAGPRLPLAKTPAAVGRPRFVRRSHRLTVPCWQSLRARAAANRVTPAMVLASAYAEVLARWSGDTQFLLNMPLFDRQTEHPGIEHAVADFTNLLLLRCDCRDPASFAERAQRIQRQFHQDVAHAAYSAVAVQRDLVKHGRAEGVAAPVVFACNLGTPLVSERGKATLGELGYMVSQTPQVWLDHQVYEDESGLLLAWDAVEDLFPAGLIDDMFQAYCGLLEWLAAEAAHWQQAPLLPLPAAQAAVRAAVNRTDWAHTVQPLHAGLFAVAAETPSRIALIAGECRVGYGELAERALRVAALLRERGLSPGEAVAVSLPRGVDQVCAVFGVLAAGGCYVPVGVHQPLARQEKIHASAGIRWVLGDAAHRHDPVRDGTTRLDVAAAWRYAPLAEPVAVSAEARAYLIFTSGSTGAPKGVEMTHAGAANTLDALNARYGVGPHSRVLAVSSLDFDLSVYDLFGVLGVGGAVVLLDEAQRRDAGAWLELIHRHGVTLWNSVPVLLDMLLVMAESDGRRLPFEQVFLSGDWIGLDLPGRLLAHSGADVKLVAMGGATEAGIWSNAFDVSLPLPSQWRSIPYGRPLPNQRYRVVDAQGRDCPDWVAGELWIGGAGLALGYCGDTALSAARFVERDGGRWYRTGDRGRYWPDGTLEFLGREDHQVKVRGHRIELGEIEAALNGLPQVVRAVAVTLGQPAVLAAAYVPTADGEQDTGEAIRTALGAVLPDYMVPSNVLAVDALPLSANGKVDRKAVVALLAEHGMGGTTEVALTPPQEGKEQRVAKVWCQVLGCERIGRESGFFALGGDSLLATQAVAALHEQGLGAEQTLRLLFARPRLMDFAAALQERVEAPRIELCADPEHRHDPFPLTEVQRAYWMGQSPGLPLSCGTHYLLELDGRNVDLDRLEQAWNRLIQHHEMLRAVVDDEGDGRQRILAQVPHQPISRSHVLAQGDGDSAQAAHAYLQRCWQQRVARREAGAHWPPFEIHAVAYGDDPCRDGGGDGPRYRIGLILDYLTLDGYSIKLLLEQLAMLYGQPQASLPALGLSFRDYVTQVRPDAARLARAEAFWHDRLATLPPAPALPLAVDPAGLAQAEFKRREARLDAALWQRLKARARGQQITPSVLLLVAYARVLRTWSGGADFTLNLTLFDRRDVHPDVHRVLGDFTSLAPVACQAAWGDDLLSQARAAQQEIAAALEHREISSIWVQRERARHTSLAAAALPVVFTSTLGLGGGLFEQAPADFPALVPGGLSATPQVWLDHQVYEYDGALALSWDAVDALFPQGLLDDMFAAYVALLNDLAGQDWTRPLRLALPATQAVVRAAVNRTDWTHTVQPLHAGLFAVAAETPSRIALIAGERRVGYGELAERALRVAALLRERGLSPGEAVAVSLPRGIDQVCAVFGVLAAGGCYVPVGVHQPLARQEKIHASAGIRWVLGDAAHRHDPVRDGTTRLDVAEAWQYAPLAEPVAVSAEARAYLIFTSGSTGAPKGVEMTHAGAANTLDALNARYGVGPHSRVLAVSSLDFDLSVYDLFGLLGVGGAVVLLDEAQRRDAGAWLDLIHRHGVTLWNSVPVLLDMLLVMAESDGRRLPFEQVFLSGDWIGLDLPGRLLAHSGADVKLVAMGGATEAGIWSNAFDVSLPLPSQWRSIPYGRPLPNQRYRVVDAQGRDCPDWVAGELWIGGAGLAKGYCGDTALSAARFVERDGGRWYRTGDRGRYWPDGTLEFLGREDHQVKVRGHRIELGEIEAALNGLPQVVRAVAVTLGQPAVLAAAYVPTADGEQDAGEAIRVALGAVLPDYMVPSSVLAVDALPLSANGKVDRKAVAALLAEHGAGGTTEVALTPPQEGKEQRVAEVWCQVLGCERIGRESGFFALGGDSLLATQAVAALHEQGLGAEQTLRLLFARPRLMDFAAALQERVEAPRIELCADPAHRHDPFPLTEVQRAYWMGQSPGLPLSCGTHYLLEFDGDALDLPRLRRACDALRARHDMLRVVIDEEGGSEARQRVVPAAQAGSVPVSAADATDVQAARDAVLAWWQACTRQADRPGFAAHVVRYGGQGVVSSVSGNESGKVGEARRCRLGLLFNYLTLDGYSIKLLIQELAALYRNPDTVLPAIGISFRDYVMQVRPEAEALARAERYWRGRLADLPPVAALPLACDPRALVDGRFSRRTARLAEQAWQRLKASARRHGITPSVVTLAVYGDVLARWSGGGAHTLNLTLFDRQPVHADIGRLVGDFTSLAPVAYRPAPETDLLAQARQMQREIAEALAHREISSIWVQRERARGMQPTAAALPIVFTSTLGMSDTLFDAEGEGDDGEAGFAGRAAFPDLAGGGLSETPQVWLDHQMYEHRGELLISWDAVDALFPAGLLDDMFAALMQSLGRLAEDEGLWQQAPLLPLPAAQAAVRVAVNRTDWAHTVQPLHAGLFAVAAETPSRIALIAGERRVGYGELAERALRVAALLRERGLSPGEAVAVSLPRGVDQVCAVFGVLAAGGCYVPVGVHQPLARQEKIHASAGIRWVLGDAAHRHDPVRDGTTRLDVAAAWRYAPLAEPVAVSAEARAYLIFTSGSTGAPKGVEMTHAGAANTLDALNARYGVGPHSRVLAVSSLDFDLSVYDLFGLLGVGGAVVLLDEAQRRDAGAWLELIHRHGVTLWNSVPVLLDMLLVMAESDGRRLPFEQVFLSGDWIGLDLPGRLLAHSGADVKLVAMGGATEAGIWSNAFDVSLPLPSQWRSIPYGRPLPNQRYRVVDAQGRDCPDWVAGELWIGGTGLAKGYCGDTALSAARFVERDGGRWYRTGDRGRYWPDGTLEFLGREDHQVKVRGHRIELGEIEAALNGLPQVVRAVAVTLGQPAVLAAAYVPTADGEQDAGEAIRAALGAVLPDYMVPSSVLAVDALPLSANGKVDRKAVAALLAEHGAEARPHEPPQGRFETQVAEVWREVLQCETVSRHDDFFLIGGDSLRATRIVQLLHGRRISPAPVPLFVLFSSPTLAALAAYVRDQWQALGAVASDEEELIEEGIL